MARMMATDDQTCVKNNVGAHCLSGSDTESLESTRANTKTKQRKKMAADSKSKTRAKHAEHADQTTTVPGSSEQLPADMAEFKTMFAELKELREEAREKERKREEQDAALTKTVKDGGEMAGDRNPGYSSGACGDIYDDEMEQDGEEYTQSYSQPYSQDYEDDDEESVTSINMDEQLNILKAACAKPKSQQAGETKETLSPFSSFKAPALPKEGPAEVTGTPTTTNTSTAGASVGAPARTKTRREFKLESGLHEGALLTELQKVYKNVKKAVTPRIRISESMAGVLQHFYEGPSGGGPKPLKTIKEISREYTGLLDVPDARVQVLNEEIRFAEGRKDGECSLLTATKGVVGALTAIAPTLDIILQRGSADPELNNQSLNMLNAMRLLICTHSQIRTDRKLNVQKVVHSRLGKELIKEKRDVYGDLPEPSEHLLGENLGEKNRQLLKSVRASDSCMSTGGYNGKRRYSQDRHTRGNNNGPYNKFRGNGRFRGQRGGRQSSSWGTRQQAPEKQFGRTSEDYAQYGNVPSLNRGGRGRGNPNRGFQK